HTTRMLLFSLLTLRHPPPPPFFPYTTLFRSASNRGALPEVLGDAGPLFEPDDPVDIGAAMLRMIDDEALAGACAAKGVVRAREFKWERTARRVYAAYEDAIRRSHERQRG